MDNAELLATFEGEKEVIRLRKKEHPLPLFNKLIIEYWKDSKPEVSLLPFIQEYPRKGYSVFLITYDPQKDYGLALTLTERGIFLNTNSRASFIALKDGGKLVVNGSVLGLLQKGSPSELMEYVEENGADVLGDA